MTDKVNTILIVAATGMEIQPLREVLEQDFMQGTDGVFERDGLRVELLITGVGMLLTGIHLMQVLCERAFDLVINVGVAGAFDRSLALGEVVEVVREGFGDLGAQDRDGSFMDVFEMGLLPGDNLFFEDGFLVNKTALLSLALKKVNGLTVNKVHGESQSIAIVHKKYQPDIETMEGIAFFYVCLLKKIPFVQIRAISNYVEPRNRDNWKMKLAVDNLNTFLVSCL